MNPVLKELEPKRKTPMVFETAGSVFHPDSCESLKNAARSQAIELTGWSRGDYPGNAIPDKVLPGIRSIGVWDIREAQDWGLGQHCNEGLEITFLSYGGLSFASPGQRQVLSAGDMTVTAPWLVHEVGLPYVEASCLNWIIIDVQVRRPNQDWIWPDWVLLSELEKREFANVVQNSDKTIWHNKVLAPLFDKLALLMSSNNIVEVETDMKILLNTIFITAMRTLSNNIDHDIEVRDNARETVRIFLARLHEHVGHNWRIEDMAEQCGLSRTSFIDKCRELVNSTPHVYLSQLRVKKSMDLLRHHKHLTLTEIAYQCGYNSSAHFSSSFHKAVGQPPSEYRIDSMQSENSAEAMMSL